MEEIVMWQVIDVFILLPVSMMCFPYKVCECMYSSVSIGPSAYKKFGVLNGRIPPTNPKCIYGIWCFGWLAPNLINCFGQSYKSKTNFFQNSVYIFLMVITI